MLKTPPRTQYPNTMGAGSTSRKACKRLWPQISAVLACKEVLPGPKVLASAVGSQVAAVQAESAESVPVVVVVVVVPVEREAKEKVEWLAELVLATAALGVLRQRELQRAARSSEVPAAVVVVASIPIPTVNHPDCTSTNTTVQAELRSSSGTSRSQLQAPNHVPSGTESFAPKSYAPLFFPSIT